MSSREALRELSVAQGGFEGEQQEALRELSVAQTGLVGEQQGGSFVGGR